MYVRAIKVMRSIITEVSCARRRGYLFSPPFAELALASLRLLDLHAIPVSSFSTVTTSPSAVSYVTLVLLIIITAAEIEVEAACLLNIGESDKSVAIHFSRNCVGDTVEKIFSTFNMLLLD